MGDLSNHETFFQSKHPELTVVHAARIEGAIEEIYINPVAQELLPKEFHYLVGQDFLKDNAVLTAPPEKANATYVTPRIWTRALTVTGLGQQGIRYGPRLSGRYIDVNGCSTSGNFYEQPIASLYPNTAWGFRPLSSSQKEVDIGNMLLAEGFHSVLPLGYVVLDDDKLESAIETLWADNPKIREDVLQNFNVFRKGGEKASILFRLRDSTQRIVNYYKELGYKGESTDTFSLHEIWETWKTICPSLTDDQLHDLIDGKAQDSLYPQLAEAMIGVIEQNTKALKTLWRHPNLNQVVTKAKDLSPALMMGDYEEVLTPVDFLKKNNPLRYTPYWKKQPAIEEYQSRVTLSAELLMQHVFYNLYSGPETETDETEIIKYLDFEEEQLRLFMGHFPYKYRSTLD